MPLVTVNGITIDYETSGDPSDPPLLLIMGLGGQLTAWDNDFISGLVGRNFFVVRFDNRDVGRSTWLDDAGPANMMAGLSGSAKPAYLLADMADDAAGLLDVLGLPSAHILGVSMGGMVAQTLAINHPSRVRSLVSIMSTTGDPGVGGPQPGALIALLRPPATDRAGAMDQAVEVRKVIGSPGFAFDEAKIRQQAGAAFDRGFHPDGTGRQLIAIMASGNRTADLEDLNCPTLVIHGEADALVDLSGGRATAAAVPGAKLIVVPGMGHHLPPELFDDLIGRISAHAHPHDSRLAEAGENTGS